MLPTSCEAPPMPREYTRLRRPLLRRKEPGSTNSYRVDASLQTGKRCRARGDGYWVNPADIVDTVRNNDVVLCLGGGRTLVSGWAAPLSRLIRRRSVRTTPVRRVTGQSNRASLSGGALPFGFADPIIGASSTVSSSSYVYVSYPSPRGRSNNTSCSTEFWRSSCLMLRSWRPSICSSRTSHDPSQAVCHQSSLSFLTFLCGARLSRSPRNQRHV